MSKKINGGCLCGAIKFELDEDFKAFYQCHCQQCQNLTGSAFASNLLTHPQNVTWLSGMDSIAVYEHPDRDFSKSFCKSCGSAVPFVNKRRTSLVVPAGSLKSKIATKVQANIFVSEKACWASLESDMNDFEFFQE
ncbi:MAG: hypothetical protein ACJAYE_000957 [Candidatus Azotimanducaceae bacterium]|jgi:hypothetical protein